MKHIRIVMIGAGNVATHISKALAGKGCAPIQVWSRSGESAATLAESVCCEAVTDMAKVVDDADLYILSVADQALPEVIGKLGERNLHGVVVHTAGTMPMQLLHGHALHYGVLYPMQTFSKQKSLDFSNIPCFVEASDEYAKSVIMQVAGMLSDRVYELSSADRKWLHIAAVFACNFTNACYSMAARILEEHGLDFSMMLPLVDEATKKLHTLNPVDAQTGPAARGDRNVMSSHLAMLDSCKDLQNVYAVMSGEIMRNANSADKR